MILFLNLYTGYSQSSCGSLPVVTGPINASALPSTILSGNLINGKHFYLNGTLTVDIPLTIAASQIEMSSTAKIILKPGSLVGQIFRITAGTSLTSCNSTGDMWYGIEIDFNGSVNASIPTLIIDGGSVIEDAQNGILSTNGNRFNLHIDQAYFNRNFRHIYILSGAFNAFRNDPNNFTVTNTQFTCRTQFLNPATTGDYLHNPYFGLRTYVAINFDYVDLNSGFFHFGTGNIIDYCDYGFYLRKSSLFIEDNTITGCEFGIYQYFDGFSRIINNRINNCYLAINQEYHVETITIADNQINDVVFGIDLRQNLKDITISDNLINNVQYTGISLMNTFLPNASVSTNLLISNNTLTNTVTGFNAMIILESIAAGNLTSYEIKENTIDNYNSGIILNYITPTNQSPTIHDNILTNIMDRPGLSLKECPRMQCYKNAITGGQLDYCYGDQTAFEFNNSNDLTITCNISNNMAQAFVFRGSTAGAKFEENTMENYVYGVHLIDNPNGLGNNGTYTRPCMNVWGVTCADALTNPFHTYSTNSNKINPFGFSNFYCNPGGEPVLNGVNDIQQYNPCTWTKTLWYHQGTCGDGGGGGEEERMLNAIAEGNYEVGSENYHEGVYLNERLAVRTDYRDSLPVLQNLYDSLQASPVAQLEIIEQLLSDSDTSLQPLIDQEIGNLNTNTDFEYAYSLLYPLLAKIDSAGINSLDSIDKTNITYLASLCASQFGTAVHRARSLYYHFYRIIISDDTACITSSTMRLSSKETKINETIKWHVNNDELILKDEQSAFIEIFDLNGKLVINNPFKNSKVNIGNLNNGFYHFRTSVGNSGNFIYFK